MSKWTKVTKHELSIVLLDETLLILEWWNPNIKLTTSTSNLTSCINSSEHRSCIQMSMTSKQSPIHHPEICKSSQFNSAGIPSYSLDHMGRKTGTWHSATVNLELTTSLAGEFPGWRLNHVTMFGGSLMRIPCDQAQSLAMVLSKPSRCDLLRTEALPNSQFDNL